MIENKLTIYLLLIVLSIGYSSCSSDDKSNINKDGVFFGNVTISTQEELDDFGALNYHTIKGNLTLSDNPSINNIVNMAKLNSLNSIEGILKIDNMANLLDVFGLDNLVSIRGLQIVNNWGILDLNSFSNITECKGEIIIKNNGSLESFCGIRSLLQSGNFKSSFKASNNLFNPTKQEIIAGNCEI